MIVAGVMSGTSADGINVAVIRVLGHNFDTRLELLAHQEFPYPAAVRAKVLSMMNARASVADLARLNVLLGEFYAEAVLRTAEDAKIGLSLIGCHGQTIYHQSEPRPFLGRSISATWQTGEGAIIAARTGVPVVSDFRQADMAAGGKGAPLVPFLDFMLYRHARRGRIVQNIGGIGNLSAIPGGSRPENVLAFDTGPGNMVIDQVTDRLFGKPFDRNGSIAARGKVLTPAIAALLKNPFFRREPPKTAGREQFGREFVKKFLSVCGRAQKEDIVATATALTAVSIGLAIRKFVPGFTEGAFHDFIVSGGGSRNKTLMQMLKQSLPDLKVQTTDEHGLPSEAKEAAAFAVMAYQTWHKLPSNVPSATGAEYPAVLGKISYP